MGCLRRSHKYLADLEETAQRHRRSRTDGRPPVPGPRTFSSGRVHARTGDTPCPLVDSRTGLDAACHTDRGISLGRRHCMHNCCRPCISCILDLPDPLLCSWLPLPRELGTYCGSRDPPLLPMLASCSFSHPAVVLSASKQGELVTPQARCPHPYRSSFTSCTGGHHSGAIRSNRLWPLGVPRWYASALVKQKETMSHTLTAARSDPRILNYSASDLSVKFISLGSSESSPSSSVLS